MRDIERVVREIKRESGRRDRERVVGEIKREW